LSEELQEAKLRESELGAELHEQCHVNTQLKQVGSIDGALGQLCPQPNKKANNLRGDFPPAQC